MSARVQLGEHFALSEFLVSESAARAGLTWPAVPDNVLGNLLRLVSDVAEPLRSACGDRPVVVTSGWRFPALNGLVGGARSSAHLDGRAMDMTIPGVDLHTVALVANDLPDTDKVIVEFGQWLHIQVAREGQSARGWLLHACKRSGETCYLPGPRPDDGVWFG